MGHLKGVTVTLIDKVEAGKDPFGKPIYKDQPIEIENVLIAPTSSDDIIDQLTLTGKKAVYTLAIPKGDSHDWTNKEVQFLEKLGVLLGNRLKVLKNLSHYNGIRK